MVNIGNGFVFIHGGVGADEKRNYQAFVYEFGKSIKQVLKQKKHIFKMDVI